MRGSGGRALIWAPTPDKEISPGEAEIDPKDPNFHRIAMELMRLKSDGYDIDDPEIARHAKREAERAAVRAARFKDRIVEVQAEAIPGEYVYYMRLRDIIKIGFSANPERRKRDLGADEILAVEPGSLKLESMRHQQFDHLRIESLGYERYERGKDLLHHIDNVRREHGKCWLATA